MSNNPTTSNMSGAGVPMKTEISHSRVRTTPDTSFGKVAANSLNTAGNVVAASSRIMAPMLPGGAVLSAAINGAGAVKSAASGAGAAGMTMSSGSLNGHVVQPADRAPAGAGGSFGDALPAIDANNPLAAGKEMLNLQASNNMQYIMLQAAMQDETRSFDTISNVMKARNDSKKNAIANVR